MVFISVVANQFIFFSLACPIEKVINMSASSLKVIHLSTGKSLRGGERQVLVLHKKLLEKGLDSVLVCRAGSELSRQGVAALIALPWHGEWDVLGLGCLLRSCRSYASSIIHCHDAHALSHGSIIGKMLGVSVLYTRRVVFPLHGDFFSRWKYRQCRKVIGISNAVAAQCRSVVAEDEIIVIPDAADWERPIQSRQDSRKALGIAEEAFVIGSVGHFTKEKNLPLIVALAKALQKIKPEVRIVCIGPVDQPIDAPANLLRTGLIPDAVNFYNAFDLYVSASIHEGLGSALLDAVVRDIPIVATDGGGTKDIFPDHWPLIEPSDEAGFIKAINDSIEKPSQAKERATVCGKRARTIFSADSVINKTIYLYDKIL
jgi:L-malate glycosyltransferase